MIKSLKNIFIALTVVIGMLLSYTVFYSDINLHLKTEITAENNNSSENLIDVSDSSADDQINVIYEISCVDINPAKNNILGSLRIFSKPSFSIWQPPKIS